MGEETLFPMDAGRQARAGCAPGARGTRRWDSTPLRSVLGEVGSWGVARDAERAVLQKKRKKEWASLENDPSAIGCRSSKICVASESREGKASLTGVTTASPPAPRLSPSAPPAHPRAPPGASPGGPGAVPSHRRPTSPPTHPPHRLPSLRPGPMACRTARGRGSRALKTLL